jgi:hypothetical protein
MLNLRSSGRVGWRRGFVVGDEKAMGDAVLDSLVVPIHCGESKSMRVPHCHTCTYGPTSKG